jgi:hypothetical protein
VTPVQTERVGVFVAITLGTLLAAPSRASAQSTPPAPHEDEAFDIMNLLSKHGLHDINDEPWNAYGQSTYISSWKLPFNAKYTNANGSVNSLVTDAERSFTLTVTLFFGVRLWQGAEAYVAPEAVAERAFSGLHGMGGIIPNFELQKTGSESLSLYRSRLYVRQRIDLGGARIEKTSDPLQLAAIVGSRRLVFTVGNFTSLDIFERNGVVGDPRQTFFNQAFMTHASYDFPGDARGYSWGGAAELYWDDWAFRIGRMVPVKEPNTQALDMRFWKRYGDSIEIEHNHAILGMAGAVRLLGYRNYENMGRFDDAIAAYAADPIHANAAACTEFNYGSANVTAPDLCYVRKPNTKIGIGLNVEQTVAHGVGVFARGMINDGQSEVGAYDSSDADLSFGAVAKGAEWHRPFDVAGVGWGMSFASAAHARYLRMGGIDGFIGDGALGKAVPEEVFEIFYSVNFLRAVWLSADYQHLWHPAYNSDRGPLTVVGGRVHAEF